MLCLLYGRVLYSILHAYLIASFSQPCYGRLNISQPIQPFLRTLAASHKSVRRQWCSGTSPGFPFAPQPFSSGLASSLAALLILPFSNKISKPLSYGKPDSLSGPAPAGFNHPVFVRSTSSLLGSMALLESSPD